MAVAKKDRRGILSLILGREGRSFLGPVSLLGGLILLSPAPAQAGSIFMKNGYIIQGPIVEHSEASVVLGWPNGKVTIFRRFVDKVDFEPGEEKNILVAKPAVPVIEEDVVITEVQDDLPPNLSELAKVLKLPTGLFEARPAPALPPDEGGSEQPPEGARPPEGGEGGTGPRGTPTVEPVATTVPAPGKELGERAGNPRWGFSLRPPQGWKVSEVEGCVSWTGPAGAKGFAPSVSVTSIKRGGLKWEQACWALREDQKKPLRDYQSTAAAAAQVAGRPAYRVSGKGAAAGGSHGPERRVVVQQLLVEEGERIWLLSTFAEAEVPLDLAAVLDSSVSSFQIGG